jgi:hypothetical protein
MSRAGKVFVGGSELIECRARTAEPLESLLLVQL